VQVQHIVAGIFDLLGADGLRAPVGRLLLLVELDVQEFAAQRFERVVLREGARDTRGDLGAVNGRGENVEVHPHGGDIEAAEVEQLGDVGVAQQFLEVWRVVIVALELHEVRVAIT